MISPELSSLQNGIIMFPLRCKEDREFKAKYVPELNSKVEKEQESGRGFCQSGVDNIQNSLFYGQNQTHTRKPVKHLGALIQVMVEMTL